MPTCAPCCTMCDPPPPSPATAILVVARTRSLRGPRNCCRSNLFLITNPNRAHGCADEVKIGDCNCRTCAAEPAAPVRCIVAQDDRAVRHRGSNLQEVGNE